MSAARVSNCLPAAWCLEQHMPSSSLSNAYGPVPSASRVGRHKQRYGETGERLVAGCIPIKYPGPVPTADTVQVMLISRGGKGWVFPKGGWEDDETVEAAAQRETVEEAGVRGSIEEPMVGTFTFRSAKQEHLHNVHQGRCRAYMFVMRVVEELETWPEYSERRRCWVPLAEASSKCMHQWMRDALNTWVANKGWTQQLAAAAAAAQQQQHEHHKTTAQTCSDSGSYSSG